MQKEMLIVSSRIAETHAVDRVSGILLQESGFDLRDVHTIVSDFELRRGNFSSVGIEVTDYTWMEVVRILQIMIREGKDIIVEKKTES